MDILKEKIILVFRKSKTLFRKRRKWFLAIFIFLVLGWLSGFGIGWWWSHGRLSRFPEINSSTRLLILSPHPDDEVLIAGGLIQRVLKSGGQVKIVYLTPGDSSVGSVIKIDRNLRLAPGDFVALANRRHDEALVATKVLGLNESDLFFLGFPDQGLREVLAREKGDPRGPVVSRSTKLDHVAYSWAYKDGQEYYADNLEADLIEICNSFKPNLVITTHPMDTHPDHKAASEIAEMLKSRLNFKFDLYLALVHYRDYPPRGFLYPPKKLFNDRWFSFELTDIEISKKRESLDRYSSQVNGYEKGWYMRFVASNEIFEM
jgi:LmbE family N-acetylglucosaminyl deacetylase